MDGEVTVENGHDTPLLTVEYTAETMENTAEKPDAPVGKPGNRAAKGRKDAGRIKKSVLRQHERALELILFKAGKEGDIRAIGIWFERFGPRLERKKRTQRPDEGRPKEAETERPLAGPGQPQGQRKRERPAAESSGPVAPPSEIAIAKAAATDEAPLDQPGARLEPGGKLSLVMTAKPWV